MYIMKMFRLSVVAILLSILLASCVPPRSSKGKSSPKTEKKSSPSSNKHKR